MLKRLLLYSISGLILAAFAISLPAQNASQKSSSAAPEERIRRVENDMPPIPLDHMEHCGFSVSGHRAASVFRCLAPSPIRAIFRINDLCKKSLHIIDL